MIKKISPKVSAIVVTFRSGSALKECLYALSGEDDIDEIIVVNNGNPSQENYWLKQFQPARDKTYKLIEGHDNIGFAAGMNLGAGHASHELFLIINPDAVLRINSLPDLENARTGRNRPTLVGGKLIYPNGEEQRGGRRELLTPFRALVTYFGLHKLERFSDVFRSLHRENDPEPQGPVSMPVISGAFCYLSAEDFRAVGGFDESYFLHVEDIDLCRRISEAGGEVVYVPEAVAMHYGSTSKVSASFVEWHKAKGLAQYFRKNASGALHRVLAQASILVFAPLLVGRAMLLRIYLPARNKLKKFFQ